MALIQNLVKPVAEATVDAVTRRGQKTVAREVADKTAREVSGDVARKVLGSDARIVAKDVAATAAAKKAAAKDAEALIAELPKLKGTVRHVAGAKYEADAARLTPNKQEVVYAVHQERWLPEWFKKLVGLKEAPETVVIWKAAADGKGEPQRVVGRTFKNAAQPAFTPDGKRMLYVEQKHVLGGGERLQEMRLKQLDLATGKAETLFEGNGFTLLHPQVSPDGKLIATYSRTPGHEGLYLLDAADKAKAPIRLSEAGDKHPIWSRDGKKVFFHTQVGGNLGGEESEKAWIGYMDLTNPKAPKRVMLDDMAATTPTYHKHPTPLGDSDLLAYHAVEPGTDKKRIEVMNILTGQRAELKLEGVSPNGAELKQFKHPAFSEDGSQLVVVGKGKKDAGTAEHPETWHVYVMDQADKLKDAFGKLFAKK